MRKFIVALLVLLVSACLFFAHGWREQKKESKRLAGNQSALLADVQLYKTQAGENAAKVQRLELTKREFEKQCATLKNEVEALGIKTKRLERVISTSSKTEAQITAPVRDSLVYRDREQPPDTLRCFNFADNYLKVDGCIEKDTFNGKIESRDTLIHAAHRVPKKFLFFRFGCKAIELEVVSKNPHTEITYSRYIELK